MHGRLKVKDSAEKAAEKAKEREKKRVKYLTGLKLLFEKRAAKEHDAEGLYVSAQLLLANPDALTLWNIRREFILALKERFNVSDCNDTSNYSDKESLPSSTIEISVDDQTPSPENENSAVETTRLDTSIIPSLPNSYSGLLEAELHVIAACLEKNPKSYGAWHQRIWVMGEISSISSQEEKQTAWTNELRLCNLFLLKDERNFHCWDYRRHVIKHGNVPLENELQYTQNLIETNFSNFSAWHYRSKLLPVLRPPPPLCPHPIDEKTFREELRRIVEAVFTDPSDQSPWFYLRWLLRWTAPCPRICWVGGVDKFPTVQVVCSFSAPVTQSQLPSVTVNGSNVVTDWVSPECKMSQRSAVWATNLKDYSRTSLEITLEFPNDRTESLHFERLSPEGNSSVKWCGEDWRPLLRPSLSTGAREALEELRQECLTLDQVDPDNKWVLLTLVETLCSLGTLEHLQSAHAYLDQLQEIDPLRAARYADSKSKIQLNGALCRYLAEAVDHLTESAESSTKFVARNLSLRNGRELHWIACCTSIDLSGNELLSLQPLSVLIFCRHLVLDGNSIEDLTPLSNLWNLSSLSMNDCGIEAHSTLLPLLELPLSSLSVNTFSEPEKAVVRAKFNHVTQLNL